MPEKITLADGTEREVFSQEEINTQKKTASDEAIETYKKDNPDKSEELTKAQEALETATGESDKLKETLDGMSDKDQNFAKLRQQVEDKNKEIEGLKKKETDSKDAATTAAQDVVTASFYDEALKQVSDGDEDLEKKVKFHYDRLPEKPKNKVEVESKLKEAYMLATGGQTIDIIGGVAGSGGASPPKSENKDKKFSNDDKEFANKFGISNEDIEKHG